MKEEVPIPKPPPLKPEEKPKPATGTKAEIAGSLLNK